MVGAVAATPTSLYAEALKVAIGHEKSKAADLMALAEKSRLGAKLMFTELATEALLYLNSLVVEFEHVLELDEIPEGEDSDSYYEQPSPVTERFVLPEEFTLPEQAILVAIAKTVESQRFYENHAKRDAEERSRKFFTSCAQRMQRRAADLKEEYERNVMTQM